MDGKTLTASKIPTLSLLGSLLLFLLAVSTHALASGPDGAKGRTLAVRFIGTATTSALEWNKWPEVLQEKLPHDAACFKVGMYDVTGNIRRGTGINCLSDQLHVGEAITVLNTVFFKMRGGTIVSQGRITAQPVVQPRAVGGIYAGMTHLTGGLPDDLNVIKSTKGFKRWTGRARCSGFVDLSELANGKIRMDNIYLVDLKKRQRPTQQDPKE